MSIPQKGTYVHADLPLLKFTQLSKTQQSIPQLAGFKFYKTNVHSGPQSIQGEGITYINDGIADVRLAPVQEIANMYKSSCASKMALQSLEYGSTMGNLELRKVLVNYLNETRGIKLRIDNILITRGSQMGIYLASQLLIESDDVVLVGETNYISADYTFLNAGAHLCRIPVDDHGVDTKAIEVVCKKRTVRAVYVTSHHHHPTTKTMSAERRLHLLNLAQEYKFAIIEDDYDYDFHYNHAPILPLVSHDVHGQVIYVGSLSKTVAPAFRIGYLIAAKEFITEASNLRHYIDRQGDPLLELTFSKFIKSGSLNRHINKTINVYRNRRDLFVERFLELTAYFDFEVPTGGMAFWLKLKSPYSWKEVAVTARKYDLEIGQWKRYDINRNLHNSIRMGFASYNEEEINTLFDKLARTMEDLRRHLYG